MSYTRRTNIRRVISKTTITSLVVSMTLAACAVGPNYTPPRSELVPFHNLADFSGAKSPSTTPLDRWWLGFNDPVLVTLVQRALDQNLDLAAALARVHQARAAARGRALSLCPQPISPARQLSSTKALEDCWERSLAVCPPSCVTRRSMWSVPRQAGRLTSSGDYAEQPPHHVTKHKPLRLIRRGRG